MQNDQHTPQVDENTAENTTETTSQTRKAFVEPQISAPADVLAITKNFFFMLQMSGDGGSGFGGEL